MNRKIKKGKSFKIIKKEFLFWFNQQILKDEK